MADSSSNVLILQGRVAGVFGIKGRRSGRKGTPPNLHLILAVFRGGFALVELWKAQKSGEPAWDSPWGKGRPGWHIECSAMSSKYLGTTIDIHSGGVDLTFPHHENEIAQSEAASGEPFVRFWLHNGFLLIDKEKMSKSLGNFMTARAARQKYPPLAIRLFKIGRAHV